MRVADGSTRPVSSPTPPRPRTDLRPTGPRRHLRSAWGPPCTRTPSLALTFARLQLLAHPHHTHTVTNDPSSQARPAGVCTPTSPCAPPSLRGARSGSLFAPCTQPGPPPLRPTRGWAPAVPRCCRKELGALRALGTAPGPRGTFVSRGAHSPRPSWCTFVSLLSSVPCGRSHRHSGPV